MYRRYMHPAPVSRRHRAHMLSLSGFGSRRLQGHLGAVHQCCRVAPTHEHVSQPSFFFYNLGMKFMGFKNMCSMHGPARPVFARERWSISDLKKHIRHNDRFFCPLTSPHLTHSLLMGHDPNFNQFKMAFFFGSNFSFFRESIKKIHGSNNDGQTTNAKTKPSTFTFPGAS